MRSFRYHRLSLLLFIPGLMLSGARAAVYDRDTGMTGSGTGLPGGSGASLAVAVSADGRVVVGVYDTEGVYQVFRYNTGDGRMTGLGTLRTDDSGTSKVEAVSADGRVVVGWSETDRGENQAFRHNEGDSKMTGLGTLRTDDSGYSRAEAVSADGRVVVGWSETDRRENQAFRHNEGDSKMIGLGTLRADGSGESRAYAVSADGRVVVGYAETDTPGESQAFRHNEGGSKMTGLGTLRADGSGGSRAEAVSADGRVVVGTAETESGDQQAFRHTEGADRMTGLGTLRADGFGWSRADAVSPDGRVVVGGAETDTPGESQAFRHTEGDDRITGLGTLRADGAGQSRAAAVSADGRVVVGGAETDRGEFQAFRHTEGDDRMTGLGTLRADNAGQSMANAVSADGRVVAGWAETDSGQQHAVVWKTTRAVDVDHTRQAMLTTARRSDRVLGLYQSQLDQLSRTRCSLGADSVCLGGLTGVTGSSSQSLTVAGLTGAVRLPGEYVSAGATLQVPVNTRLTDNYETRGNRRPSVGAWLRYEDLTGGEGAGVTLAGSLLRQDITITRDRLSGTERGHGASSVSGVQARLSADYRVHAGDTLLRPEISLSWSEIRRDGYSEVSDIDFPAVYGQTGVCQTELGLALHASRPLSDVFSVHGGAGADISLSSQREAFTGQIEYIGAWVNRDTDPVNVRPYVKAGLRAGLTASSEADLTAGWMKTPWGYDSVNAQLSYTYRF
ncbi:autotransporter domain-containing protein [Citrobacter sp. VF227]